MCVCVCARNFTNLFTSSTNSQHRLCRSGREKNNLANHRGDQLTNNYHFEWLFAISGLVSAGLQHVSQFLFHRHLSTCTALDEFCFKNTESHRGFCRQVKVMHRKHDELFALVCDSSQLFFSAAAAVVVVASWVYSHTHTHTRNLFTFCCCHLVRQIFSGFVAATSSSFAKPFLLRCRLVHNNVKLLKGLSRPSRVCVFSKQTHESRLLNLVNCSFAFISNDSWSHCVCVSVLNHLLPCFLNRFVVGLHHRFMAFFLQATSQEIAKESVNESEEKRWFTSLPIFRCTFQVFAINKGKVSFFWPPHTHTHTHTKL